MEFPPFWAKGTHGDFSCWRWSSRNLVEARTLADEAARKLAERFAAGQFPRDKYGYPDRPLREPVLREFRNPDGELTAALTRNSYGCFVLNTAALMFVDVDLPDEKPAGGFLARLFGGKAASPASSPHDRAIASARAWVERNAGWGWRVYRTRAGLRLLATHGPVAPESDLANRVFDALGADPLYRRLCKTQKCYRARLTPKPWRCGSAKPPARWPWATSAEESRFLEWEKKYIATCASCATCEFLMDLGNPRRHPDIDPLIHIHDDATRADSKLGLA
jgi:hypothetical protein